MIAWTLIVVFVTFGAGAPSSLAINHGTEEACKTAGALIKQKVETETAIWKKRALHVEFVCVPK